MSHLTLFPQLPNACLFHFSMRRFIYSFPDSYLFPAPCCPLLLCKCPTKGKEEARATTPAAACRREGADVLREGTSATSCCLPTELRNSRWPPTTHAWYSTSLSRAALVPCTPFGSCPPCVYTAATTSKGTWTQRQAEDVASVEDACMQWDHRGRSWRLPRHAGSWRSKAWERRVR